MELISFTSLFEVFIGFNLAYVGVDSFSETILGYIYFKYDGIKKYKSKIAELRNKLNSLIVDKVTTSTVTLSQQDRNLISEKKNAIDQLNNTLRTLQEGNLYNIKSEIYKLYDKNKYKPLFLLNGIYFGIILFIICLSDASLSQKASLNIFNTLNILSAMLIATNTYTGIYRLKKVKYKTIKNTLLTISVLIILTPIISASISNNYKFPYLCSYLYRIDNSCHIIFISLSVLLMCTPFIFELISLFNFINKEFIARIDNAYNLLLIKVESDNEPQHLQQELHEALLKLNPDTK